MGSEGMRPLPATTSDAVIVTLMEELKQRLRETDYGEVGLVFTVHNRVVVKYQKIDIRKCALSEG